MSMGRASYMQESVCRLALLSEFDHQIRAGHRSESMSSREFQRQLRAPQQIWPGEFVGKCSVRSLKFNEPARNAQCRKARNSHFSALKPLRLCLVKGSSITHITSDLDIMDSSKRKRSRLACKPCRDRKRKCDGNEPCITCTDWGYVCYYEARDARRRSSRGIGAAATPSRGPAAVAKSSQQSVMPPVATSIDSEQSDNRGVVRRLEANSGAAFVRKLGLKIDPTKAPKLNLFGWNVGARKLSSPVADDFLPPLPITEITSLSHMKSLAETYFDQVDPCYGFIDHAEYYGQLDRRWASPVATYWLYDSVLAGVAALGCVFSQHNATITELHLVRLAQSNLDNAQLSGPPSMHLLTGWTLRTVYLRITDSPYATWIASCTLMHLVEASGLHPQTQAPSLLVPSTQLCDADIAKRLVGVAHHLNAWSSFDLGLRRVSFDLPSLPSPREGDYTAEVLSLLPVSLSLDPNSSKQETDLIETLSNVLNGSHTMPPSVMAQCNLTLCILRRIHSQNLELPFLLAERVLSLLRMGLECARRMTTDCHPWHQVANVPFNMICILLTMDTRGSLALLPEAMQTLFLVRSNYDTDTMREACSTACLLVRLHQQRRRDDIHILTEALKEHGQQTDFRTSPLPDISPSAEDYSWLGALVADMPGLQRVDFDQFLNADLIDDLSFPGR